MKGLKIWLSLFIITIIWYIFSFSFVNEVQAINISIINTIDTYYDGFTNQITDKTDHIWIPRVRTRVQNRLRNRVLSSIQKKIFLLKWEEKMIYQIVWLKILQRKDALKFSTNDLVVQRELIALINSFRKEKWLSQLSYNPLLTKAAYNHANDMYINFPYDTNGDGIKENISHFGTNGRKVQDRVESLWYIPYFVWENIWYNQQTPEEILLARKNSPTHYSILIATEANEIWVVKLGSYWVMVIGTERKNN